MAAAHAGSLRSPTSNSRKTSRLFAADYGRENGVVALLAHFLYFKNGLIGLRPHFPRAWHSHCFSDGGGDVNHAKSLGCPVFIRLTACIERLCDKEVCS